MKFVKTVNGDYINAAHVQKFFVLCKEVHADVGDGVYLIDKNFKTDEEAQKWLDELIDELNRDGD